MDILKDLGIGVPSGLKSTDKQSLIDVVNKGLLNESDLKTNVINALNTVNTDGTKLSTSALWGDVLSGIPNIKTGKKWASGTLMFNTQVSAGKISIFGLRFTPKLVVIKYPTGNTNMGWIVYMPQFLNDAGILGLGGLRSYNNAGAVVENLNTLTTGEGFALDGFSFITKQQFAGTCYWIAFE